MSHINGSAAAFNVSDTNNAEYTALATQHRSSHSQTSNQIRFNNNSTSYNTSYNFGQNATGYGSEFSKVVPKSFG